MKWVIKKLSAFQAISIFLIHVLLVALGQSGSQHKMVWVLNVSLKARVLKTCGTFGKWWMF